MRRRNVLIGLTAGIPLIAGCSALLDSSSGEDETTQSTDDAETPTTSAPTTSAPTTSSDSETPTAVATTITDTVQQTATRTATIPTPTATAIPQPTSTSTVGTVERPDTTAISGAIDLSTLKTYSNSTYSYSIKRPAQWKAYTTNALSVSFMSPSGSNMTVAVKKNIQSSTTLNQFAQKLLGKYKQNASESNASANVLDQRKVSLSNGTTAILIEMGVVVSGNGVRQKILFTLTNGMAYVTSLAVPKSAYTSEIEKQINTILLSLTIG